ncbi:hypothetical protein [Longibaculum muris]|uniref:hypothetical protein n=1 Tax=Longibaculum muris TaxID=1796628 RepID=UPI00189F05F7|nr:hypothetical protein [Longibaculum muris]
MKMKESLKRFYEYLESDEDLMYCVRIQVEWNEEAFLKMKRLSREVMKDYAHKDNYPKRFIAYFMWEIPTIIDILSQFKHCSKKDKSKGYTDETYRIMITEKINQLKKLQQEFISSLNVY